MFVRILIIMTGIGMVYITISPNIAMTKTFVLLQEVDRSSRRSYHHDQYEGLGIMFDGWEAIHALNYKNVWNPMPLTGNALG